MKSVIVLILVLCSVNGFTQIQLYYVQPTDVDPGYFMDDDSSAIAYNSSLQINKLFIWIGGTNASSSGDYASLKNLSASLGFHFINLNYIDTVAAAPLGNDPDSLVFDKFRQENVFGTPLCSYANVDTFNSIYTRAVKMLQYLSATYPSQNWGQYLATSNTLDWTKILVGGHSQGSGHACYLAKNFPVERVLMASGPNDYYNVNNTAGHWLRQPGVTPVGRHYSYLSLNDEIVNYSKQFTNITGLGMLINDDSTHVDAVPSPYNNSHCLYTTQAPGIVILNHNATVKFSALNADVWTYMLTDPITLGVNEQNENSGLMLYPNPAENILYLQGDQSLVGKNYAIYNLSGQIILSGKLTNGSIDVSVLEKGCYLVKVDGVVKRFVRG